MNPRTSRKQFEIMISYMEKHGDISRPGVGACGRLQNITMWHELVDLLNADPSGIVKSHDKWRRVWSDIKGSTKRKYHKYQEAVKINPNTRRKLSDIEKRILPLVCGPNISYSEADSSKTQTQDSDTQQDAVWMLEVEDEDDDAGGESASPEHSAPHEDSAPDSPISLSPSPLPDTGSPLQSTHPHRSNTKNYSIVDALLELNRLTRENESNRDRMMYKLEKERLRQRDVELRQRDAELKLQGDWLSFLNGALDAVHSYFQTSKK